jgi:prevent-host-death family protein
MTPLSASEFKARCLAVLAEVAQTGETVTILKRGRPLARIVPVVEEADDYPQQALAGTLDIVGDVITPVLPPDAWDAERK